MGEEMTYENLIAYNEAYSGLSTLEVVFVDDIKDLRCNWLNHEKDEKGHLYYSPICDLDKDEKTIVIKIHLDRKNEDIFKEVKYLIKFLKQEAEVAHIDLKEKRPRWDEYDKYLDVYDLREKAKKSWRKIARELFPEDKSKDEGISKVRHYYKQAEKMINGGWHQI
jgi:preprotein translocase subunit Sss1